MTTETSTPIVMDFLNSAGNGFRLIHVDPKTDLLPMPPTDLEKNTSIFDFTIDVLSFPAPSPASPKVCEFWGMVGVRGKK